MPRNGGWPGTAPTVAHSAGLSRRRSVCLPADRRRHPADAGGNFILTCKPASHQTIAEYLQGAELQEHRQTICKRGKRTTTIYRWLYAVPLRATDDAILVNWFSIETLNAKGKRTYYNSFVTDLAITRDTVAELAACGRARWKIENETFNVLKTNGYNLEHNFGHGKKTLASVLVTLNLLAFAFHTAAYLGVLAWRAAVIARGANIASSSTCGRSPPMSYSRTGLTCSSPSPRPPYGHLDPGINNVPPLNPPQHGAETPKNNCNPGFRIAVLPENALAAATSRLVGSAKADCPSPRSPPPTDQGPCSLWTHGIPYVPSS